MIIHFAKALLAYSFWDDCEWWGLLKLHQLLLDHLVRVIADGDEELPVAAIESLTKLHTEPDFVKQVVHQLGPLEVWRRLAILPRNYEELLRELKQRYGIHLHCFSPPEIYAFTQLFNLSTEEVLRRLKDAGLDSIPGGGAEILVDEVRKKNTTKCNTEQWLEVMETAHRLGLPTTATMMFGLGETWAHRIEHLDRLYELQARTHGFVAFIPWTLQPDNTKIGRKIPDRRSSEEYLRWLGMARLYLDIIPNIQVSWLTQGVEIGRQGLHFGANDLGSIMIEENVITPAGAHHRATEDVLRNAILAEGLTPCKRKANYVRLKEPAVV